MNLLTIAFKSIRQRALASALTGLSVALGVMLMVAVLVIFGIVDRVFSQRAIGYDLIVGPKGSDLQLVLSTVYRISPPIENLPYRYYLQLKEDPRVSEAIPIALGDVTEEGAFPIVGTVPRYFAIDYMPGEKFRVKGRFLRKPFDAVIGSQVARQNNWGIGDQFTLVHGGAESDHVHDEKFEVVGVLAPTGTPNDKTVFIDLNGFYQIAGHEKPLEEAFKREREFFGPEIDEVHQRELEKIRADEALHGSHSHDEHDHGHHHHHHEVPVAQKEVTSVLLLMKSPMVSPLFSGELKKGFQAQAVNPIVPMRRLMDSVVGNVRTMLVVLTGLIILVSGIGIFVSIYNSMADRRKEIAIMRALGARRQTVLSVVLLESILLCVGGGLLGMLLGHALVFTAAPIVEARSGLLIDPWSFEPLEAVLLPVLIALASLVGFIPAMTAYRTDVARTLSD